MDLVESFLNLWSELTFTQAVLWGLALVSVAAFVFMTLLSLVGFGLDVDLDFDGGDGGFFAFFTLRNMLAFFLGFSWTGLMLLDWGLPIPAALLGGAAVGLLVASFVVLAMKGVSRLSSSGNLELVNAVGAEGSVSIVVPGNKKGHGKVSIPLQGRLVELEAITDSVHDLRRTTRVRVTEISGHQLVVTSVKT